jgi:aspartate racemase
MIGVLGGMGPAATVDFLAKLVRFTPDPRIPDRVAPIMQGCGPSPLPALRAGIHRLEQAGAAAIAIPCHTAHFWYDEMLAASNVPILHIADAVLAELARRGGTDGPVGLLATAATLKAAFYQERLGAAGYACTVPAAAITATCVLPAIALVKRNRAVEAAPLLSRALDHLLERGAQRVLLACTELPLATRATSHPACVDAIEALARACIAWHREHGRVTGHPAGSARN